MGRWARGKACRHRHAGRLQRLGEHTAGRAGGGEGGALPAQALRSQKSLGSALPPCPSLRPLHLQAGCLHQFILHAGLAMLSGSGSCGDHSSMHVVSECLDKEVGRGA